MKIVKDLSGMDFWVLGDSFRIYPLTCHFLGYEDYLNNSLYYT